MRSLRLEVELELASDGVPRAAHNRLVVEALRHFLDQAAAGHVLGGAAAAEAAPPGPKIHKKSARSVHRFVLAVDRLLQRGKAPALGEVGREAALSGPPLAKIVNPETPAGAYAAPLIKVRKQGRTKRITLTPRGRQVAARVASGELAS